MLTPAQAARVEAMRKSAGPSGAFAVTTCSLEAVKAMEQAHEALMAAWRDLLEWEQLATNTRKALKEAGKSPDHEPYCPSERGIARTQIVRHAVGRAATELRKHLPQENE